ncbi:EMILIN-3 [Cololabis saira]|uniref:EMILIN-3 n=1 Tax=Cololabis saira TaxID=129043 RepID=UPI002AD47989|nr:EMILIN-3 [Cololabis saira]
MKTRLCQLAAQFFLLGVLLPAVDSKGTLYGGHVNPFYGNRYHLYRAGLNPPNKPMTRHKNHCAYMVQKNVTCTMQDGVETYVKAEYTTKCIWGQKCPVVMYRTVYKPTYKVGFKTVTELEWRCCPGYSGEACHDGSPLQPDGSLPHGPGVTGFPHGPRPSTDPKPGGGQIEAGKPFPGVATGQVPGGSEKPNYGDKYGISGVTGERLDRMEENMRRLTQGLDTLNGVVATLEERLRTSLQEGMNKFVESLLPKAVPVSCSTMTDVCIHLETTSHNLEEVKDMVIDHDGQLKRLLGEATGRPIPAPDSSSHLDKILSAKLTGLRTEIIDGFDHNLTNVRNHCNDMSGKMQKQCHKEHVDTQENMQESLDGMETKFRNEMGSLQVQIQALTQTENCCGQANSLSQRMLRLEESVKKLTESQSHLQTDLSEKSTRIETLIQERVSMAVEQLSNVTIPALLEGQAVPEHKPESVRKMEGDLSGIQKQLIDLELLCTSSCAPSIPPAGSIIDTKGEEDCAEVEKKVTDRLDLHSNQLGYLNHTLNTLLLRSEKKETEGSVQGEITLINVKINTVNRTLKDLKDSIGFISTEVDQATSSQEQREHQLVNQVQGITRLMGHQASLLGASERRLAQLKGELASLKRRLTGGLQDCHSTALEVQKEVKSVDSRVNRVAGQCSNMEELAEHLERIRAELERYSDSYLAQVNGTLTSHTEQLAELKEEVKDCVAKDSANQK